MEKEQYTKPVFRVVFSGVNLSSIKDHETGTEIFLSEQINNRFKG